MKSMHGMNNSGKLFSDELIEWFLEADFIQSQCQISIYYKDAPDGTRIFVLFYLYDCEYWYNFEALGKGFWDYLERIFRVKFSGYAQKLMSIRISHTEDHSISVDQARYVTSIVAKYLINSTVKTSIFIYKTTFTSDMIFTKANVFSSYEQVETLTMESNIHYRACIGSLIY